ncbi:hypothetical protein [Brevibacillus migulae]|uniref:hypothetical protein n=1 Tax=Brevibacillus migulae TaxID=1644114 RepID=UPI001F1CB306|nr:hypothetical protein [Brevibacillus migulae]
MRSHDEQSTWEELKDFPDPILPWERKQVIIKNIRKKRKQMQKLEQGKRYVGWVTNGLITCAVLFAFIWLKPFTPPVKTEASQAAIEQEGHPLIEQKYITAAQKAIKALGIQKDFHFVETEEDADYFVVQTKNREALVSFKPNTTEVRTVAATIAFNELPDSYQKYEQTARKASQEANPHLLFQTVYFYKDSEKSSVSFQVDDRQFVRVDLKTNKVDDFHLYFRPDDVDIKAVAKAQQALSLVSNKTGFSFTHAEKSSYLRGREAVWRLSNTERNEVDYDKYAVEIDAKTNKIYKVQYVTDLYKIKSIDEVIPVTKPLVKSIFGIDTTGYKAYGGRSWGGYLLKREGSPTITVSIFDLNIGNVYSISIEKI